jgi:hypothetical protein
MENNDKIKLPIGNDTATLEPSGVSNNTGNDDNQNSNNQDNQNNGNSNVDENNSNVNNNNTDVNTNQNANPTTDNNNTSNSDDDSQNNNGNPDENQEAQEVEIDGVIYTLDENGNAVGDSGIAYTAEQLKEFEVIEDANNQNNNQNDNQTSDFDLMNIANIKIYNEDGSLKTYENTPEGQRQYIEDVFNTGAEVKAKKILEERYSLNPLIKVVEDYIIANGSLEGFSEQEFVHKPLTDSSTEEEMIATIRAARKAKGDTEVEIANLISWAKADNKLKEVALTSDSYLQSVEENRKQLIEQQAENERQKLQQRNLEYIQSLNNIINDGKLNVNGYEVVIPPILEVNTANGKKAVDRSELIKYATEVNQYKMPDGRVVNATQYQIDKYVRDSNRNINDDVFEMLSLFTKTDNYQILQSAINKNKSNEIKKRLKLKMKTSNVNNANNANNKKIKLRYT